MEIIELGKNEPQACSEAQLAQIRDEEFRKIRMAFLNILEDTEDARQGAVKEKNKTLTIVDNLTDGVLVLDENNRIELTNPLVDIFLKQKQENLLGKNIFKIKSKKSELSSLVALLKSGKKNKIKNIFRKELLLGDKLYLEVTTVPLEENNNNRGTLIILHDVSRDKFIETIKTEFVSIAAHQLRTPLSAIKWTLKMMLDGDIGKITAEQKDLLEKTYQSNERMIALINDLLNVTRIEEGRFLYKPEPMQMEDIVDTVINNSEEILRMKKTKLKFNKPKELLPEVLVDKEKMSMVVQNLLENAIKYTNLEAEIDISLEKTDKDVLFKIKDSGVGIPKEQQERIFTKFFRGSNVIKMETDGSGLGLYTTKNIVESHSGKIWFDSEEGKGTTFYFTVPFI
ncbi:MAG: ATP-binding protein [Candidatus Paceibacterota bacterium]|jgi:PAS domain S-box-containing protein